MLFKSQKEMEGVKACIREMTSHPFGDTPTGKVLDSCVNLSGKMLRARLLLYCSRFGDDSDIDKLYNLAAIVEILHLASLIHDDIIDEARFRRGKPSVQSRFGKDAAVYAGDYLIARVNYYEAVNGLNKEAEIFSQTIAHMCAGEIGQALCRYDINTGLDRYIDIIKGKTAALFSAACRVGAMGAGCGGALTDMLAEFGLMMGIMFQLRDDLMDYSGKAKSEGKDAYKDLKSGIYTLPVLLSLSAKGGDAGKSGSTQENELEQLRSLLNENARRSLGEDEIFRVMEAVDALGGVKMARAMIEDYKNKAIDILKKLPEIEEKKILREILDKLTE